MLLLSEYQIIQGLWLFGEEDVQVISQWQRSLSRKITSETVKIKHSSKRKRKGAIEKTGDYKQLQKKIKTLK